jgi:hypothetical protein
MSRGDRGVVAINGESNAAKVALGRTATTAHELFHQTQSQLSNDKKSKGLYWMSEGTADVVGAWVAERRGFQSLDKWKLDRFNVLRRAKEHASPYEILHTNLDKWFTLMENKLYPYEMSDLMVFYLTINYGKINGMEKIAEYYRQIGAGIDGDKALEQAFGVSPVDFVASFHAWFIRSMSEEAKIELIAEPGVTATILEEMEKTILLSRRFFQETWKTDFSLGLRIVVAPDKDSYKAAIVREFGLSMAQAEQTAKNSSWYYAKGTGVIEGNIVTARPQRMFSLTSFLVRKYLEQNYVMSTLDNVCWLRHGLEDVLTASIVETDGGRTVKAYRADWSGYLTKRASPKPSEMVTVSGWEASGEKYGVLARRRAAAIAACQLVDRYGLEALGDWLAKSAEMGDGSKAYKHLFGELPME